MKPSDPADAFRALYERHRDDVWRYLVRRAGRDAAEDLTTEVFVVAWRRHREVPDTALPWLYGVARRVAANHRRATGRAAALTHLVAGHSTGSAADHADTVHQRQDVVTALAGLSEDDRELILLVAWEGLTLAEAAVALGCRPATARVRMHRARKRLQLGLDAHAPELGSLQNA